MGSINLINSGLDVQGIVDSLIAVERQPVRTLEKRQAGFEKKVTAYGDFNSKLTSLLGKIHALLYRSDTPLLSQPAAYADRLSRSIFAGRSVASSDESILEATAGKTPPSGTYEVTVSALARARSMATSGFASTADATATGTLTINGTDLVVDSTNNTLEGIRQTINAADLGVTATIVNTGGATPYRLSITSNESGTAEAFTLTDGLTGGAGQALGLTETVAAADAALTINGLAVTSGDNTLDDAIPGLTLRLAGTGTVTITSEPDLDGMVAAMKDLVTAYNEVNTFISSQFQYNSTSKTSGTLSGEVVVRSAQSDLQSALTQGITVPGSDFRVIGQLGITTGRDGSLTFDEAKFRDAVESDPDGAARLFLGGDGAAGVAAELEVELKRLTDTLAGPIQSATKGLEDQIADIEDRIEDYEERLEQRREILLAEYSKADQALRLLGVAQGSLTAQTNALGYFTR